MAGSVLHAYTQTVADGTATSVVRPSDWNSHHVISGLPDGISIAGTNTSGTLTAISSGTFYLAGGNNITLSQVGQSVTISGANAGGAQTGLSGLSAGTTQATSGTVIFSNSNGVSFGLNGNTVTATVKTDYLTTAMQSNAVTLSNINVSGGTTSQNLSNVVFSNSNGVSFGLNGSTVTGSVAAGATATGNLGAMSAAGSSVSAGTVVFSNSNNVSFGMNGSTVTASATVAAQIGISGIVVSNTTYTSGTVSFSNANGISFGSSAGQAITASYTVPTQTNQSGNVYASSNTFGTSSGTYDARSLSIAGSGAVSVAASNSGWVISAPTQTVQTQNCVDVTLAGNTSGALALVSSGTVTFAGGNNITLSQAGNAITISGANAAGAQTGISGIVVSDTTYTSGTVSFSNQGNVTIGSSVNGATQYIRLSVAAQTNQSGNVYASSNTFGTSSGTYDARSISIAGSGAVSVAASNFGWVISAPVQTNQGGNAYASSNTFGTSSGTYDARSISIAGSGAVGVAASNSGWVISAPVQTAQTQSNIQAVYDGANSISTGTIRFTNANGVSFSINGQTISASVATSLTNVNLSAGTTSNNLSAFVFSNSNNVSFGLSGSTVTATVTVAAQSNQTGNVYASSNTTGTTSGTYDARSLSVAGAGAISVAASNSGWVVSSPVTSSLSATGLVSVSTNGSTISVGAAINFSAGTTSSNVTSQLIFGNSNGVNFGMSSNTVTALVGLLSFFEVPPVGNSSALSLGNSSLYLQPFQLMVAGSFCRLGDIVSMSPLNTTGYSTASTLAAGVTLSNQLAWGVTRTYGLWTQGTGTNSTRLESMFSSTWRMGATAGYTLSDGAITQTVANGISYDVVSNVGTNGAYTMSTIGASSTATGAASTSVGNTFSDVMSGLKNIYMGFATSLSAGNYWLGILQSSASASTGVNSTLASMSALPFTTQTSAFWLMGRTTNANSNQPLGGGVYSAGTGAIPQNIAFSEVVNSNASNMRHHFVLENQSL